MSFNRNDPADLAALKSEMINDPLSSGYNLASGDIANIVSLINAKNYTVSKPKISSADVRSTCTYDAYNALSIDEQEWIRWMTGANGFEEENLAVTADLREKLTAGASSIWADGQRDEMTAAMLALIDVPGSRAEVLFGHGTIISLRDCTTARDS